MSDTNSNEFFDPKSVPFEVLGYTEEFQDAVSYRYLGGRALDKPTRAVGSPGLIKYELKETLVLTKGLKTVRVRATPSKPKLVFSKIIVVCGKLKQQSKQPLFLREK